MWLKKPDNQLALSLLRTYTQTNKFIIEKLSMRKIWIFVSANNAIYMNSCVKPVDNLQQTCYHENEASDTNESHIVSGEVNDHYHII